MLSLEAQAPFVLTLHSVPPFLIESILALALVVLLAVPLIAHIQLFLDRNSNDKYETRNENDFAGLKGNPIGTVVMHYPILWGLHKSSNSDLNVELATIRTSASTPTIKRSLENLEKICRDKKNGNKEALEKKAEKSVTRKKKSCLPLERSSPFVATNAQLAVVDISDFDYDTYRHKLIETSLKRQYGERQAPGDVVLNSIHLNSIGSQTGIQLSDSHSHSLFDFIDEYYDATALLSKKEKEYLHPLDHFLVKGQGRPSTADRSTDTKESNTELDQVPELIDFRDQNSFSTNPLAEKRHDETTRNPSKVTIRSRRSSSLPRTSSKNLLTVNKSNISAMSRKNSNSTTQQLFNRAENLNSQTSSVGRKFASEKVETPGRNSRSRVPRDSKATIPRVQETPRSSSPLVQGKSSAETFTLALSTDQEKEPLNCLSGTWSDAGSLSSSSKPREKLLVRSRTSSLSSKTRNNGKISNPSKQWYSGSNTQASFNNNYSDVQRESSVKNIKPKTSIRPKSTGGRFDWDVPDVPGQNWLSERITEKSSSAMSQDKLRIGETHGRRRSQEKRKSSDTILPVLESVVDIRVDVPWEDEVEVVGSLYASKIPSGKCESQRSTRARDLKMNGSSFAKSSLEQKNSMLERPSSSSKSNNRPVSASRLPVLVGSERTRKILQEQKTGEVLENRNEASEKLDKNGSAEKVKNRPGSTGHVRSNVSLEEENEKFAGNVSQLRNIERKSIHRERTVERLTDKQSQKKVTRNECLKSSSNAPTGMKRTTPSAGSCLNKTGRGIAENDRNISEREVNGNMTKKSYLRARSGKYAALNSSGIQRKSEGARMIDVNEESEKIETSKFPNDDSTAGHVMRPELKTCMKKIKLILNNRDKSSQMKDLASLGINETIIPELSVLLNSGEINELQSLFDRFKKQQEISEP